MNAMNYHSRVLGFFSICSLLFFLGFATPSVAEYDCGEWYGTTTCDLEYPDDPPGLDQGCGGCPTSPLGDRFCQGGAFGTQTSTQEHGDLEVGTISTQPEYYEDRIKFSKLPQLVCERIFDCSHECRRTDMGAWVCKDPTINEERGIEVWSQVGTCETIPE